MKKTFTILIVALLAYLAWVFLGKKPKTTTTKKTDILDITGKQALVESGYTYANLYGYNPNYTLESSKGLGMYGYGSSYSYITDGNSRMMYNLPIEKLREIDMYISLFIEDVKKVGTPYNPAIISYFANLSNEGKRFAQEALTVKGYVMTDADGNKYIIDSFASVFQDNLQKLRTNVEIFKQVFNI